MLKLVLSASRSLHTFTSSLQEKRLTWLFGKLMIKYYRTANFWKCTFLKFYLSLVGNLKVLFTDLCVRWSIHYQIGLNEKNIKLSHDSKIAAQVFKILSLKFPNLRIHWMLSTILKASNKSAWSNIFWYIKVCTFWVCSKHYTLR